MARRVSHPKDSIDAIIEEIDTTIGRLLKIPATGNRDAAVSRLRKLKSEAVITRQAVANIRRWE